MNVQNQTNDRCICVRYYNNIYTYVYTTLHTYRGTGSIIMGVQKMFDENLNNNKYIVRTYVLVIYII